MNNVYILILSKDLFGNYDNNLLSILLNQNNINNIIISDEDSLDLDGPIKKQGFYNLTRSPYIKKPSSWDKAFYYIYQNSLIKQYDYYWFIEDDVYSKNYDSLINFIITSNQEYDHDLITKCIRPKSHHPTWKHWKEEYINQFKFPSQSFNPICRLSSRLISKVFQYQKDNFRFDFHEILFASLCKSHDLSYIEYVNSDKLNKYIGQITYKPVLLKENINDDKIYHPVKKDLDARKFKATS